MKNGLHKFLIGEISALPCFANPKEGLSASGALNFLPMRNFFKPFFYAISLIFFLLTSPLWGSAVSSHATVYFSPDDQLEKRLVELIEKENKSIHVCIYTFTHRGIANALIDAFKRGVEVEVIVDRFSVKIKSPLQKVSEAGIPVYVWDPDRLKRKLAHRPLMHNKFCVFGLDKVWTGSFNFTYEATKIHQENAIVLQDAALASAYKGQFHTIKLRSCIPLASYVAMRPKKKMVAHPGSHRKTKNFR